MSRAAASGSGAGSAQPAPSAPSAAPPILVPRGAQLVSLVLRLLPPPPEALALPKLGERFLAESGVQLRECTDGVSMGKWLQAHRQHFAITGGRVKRASPAAANAPAPASSGGSAAVVGQSTQSTASNNSSGASVGSGASSSVASAAAPAASPGASQLVALVQSILPADGAPVAFTDLGARFKRAAGCVFKKHPLAGSADMQSWVQRHADLFALHNEGQVTAAVSRRQPAPGVAKTNSQAPAAVAPPATPVKQKASSTAAAAAATPSSAVKAASAGASTSLHSAATTPSRPPIPHAPQSAGPKVSVAVPAAQPKLAPQPASAVKLSVKQAQSPVQQVNKPVPVAAASPSPKPAPAPTPTPTPSPAAVPKSALPSAAPSPLPTATSALPTASTSAASPVKWALKLPTQPTAASAPQHAHAQTSSSSSSPYRPPPPPPSYNNGRCSAAKAHSRLNRAINDITAAYQSAAHAAGRYPGPIEHVYECIIAHEDFLEAAAQAGCRPPAASTQGGPSRWTVGAFVQLCSRSDNSGKAVLDLPSMLAELLDLLESVSLLLECAAATPVETLWDVAVEIPLLLNEKCLSVVMVDSKTGTEYKRFNRFERYRWNFRSYADLRLGRIENHPLARRIFNVPPDLVAVPRFTKKDLLDFTAGWMPKGPTQELFRSGAVSEEKLLAALRMDTAVRAKLKPAVPSPNAAPSDAERVRRRLASFSHPHPLRPIEASDERVDEEWECILCEAPGEQGDESRFICEEMRCGLDAHSKCVARSPLLLKQLSAEERARLERLHGPVPSVSSGPAAPLDRYLCVHIGSKFHYSIGMLKRIRGLAFEFQNKYKSDLQPKLEAETMRRCDERVQLLYSRLARQLQPTGHLYRECGKKVRDLLMQLEEEDVQAAEPAALAQAAAELGIAADASVTLQRSLLRRSHRIQSLRRLLETRLSLVDARGVPLQTQSPLAGLYRLLASSAPLLVDLVSERLHFVSDPEVLRRAEKKRREDIEAAGGVDLYEQEEKEQEEEEKEEERKRASASSRSSKAKGKAKAKAASLPVFAERDGGEAAHGGDDDEDLFDDPVVAPYSEGGVRAHMHQLASHPAANGQSSSPSMLNQIRKLQSHLWRAYCDLHSDCDATDPPSLLEWLETQPALQADVEAWAAKRAGLLDAKQSAAHGDAEQQQRQLVPVYSTAELTHLLAVCVQAMQSAAMWSEWAAEAAKAPAASSRAASSGQGHDAIDVVRSVPAARRRVMRALQLHFGVSEAEQLGRGSLDQLLDLPATSAINAAVRPRGAVHIIPAVQVLAASRDEHLPAITQLPAHRPALRAADEPRERTSALHADAMELQRCALASLVRVPFLSDAAATTHWSLSFEPALGHIETFVRTYSSELLEAAAEEAGGKVAGFLLLHASAGALIRLDPAATTDTLMRSSHSGAHCALQLVSLLAKGADGSDQADARSIADALHMLLADVLAAAPADQGLATAAAFLLDLLAVVPQSLLRLCADLVLPVAAAVMFPEQSNASDSLYAVLLQQAVSSAVSSTSSSSAAHVSLLHQLGLAMRIPAWTLHFMEEQSAGRTAVTAELKAADSKPAEQSIAAYASEDADSSSVAVDPAVPDAAEHAALQLPTDSPAADTPTDAAAGISATTSSMALVASNSSSSSGSGLSPRAVIASIRKARGLDESYLSTRSAETSVVDAEKNALLHSALELLSVELYQSRVHFIAECIQNSEDNNYVPPSRGGPQVPALIFRLTPTDLYLVNNESGFEERNVRSICDLGGSSKKMAVRSAAGAGAGANAGDEPERNLIGHKGIGFKSVYVISTNPQIFSNGYAFQLGVEESAGDDGHPDERRVHNVGMLCPSWIDDADVPPAVPLLKERHAAQTVIRLPLKAELHKHKVAAGGVAVASVSNSPDGWHELRQQFIQIFEPNLLLFLRQVRLLSLEQAATNDARRPPATTSLRRLASTADAPDIVEIVETHCTPADVADGVAGRSSTHRFLLVQRSFAIPEARRKELRWQSAPTHTQIAVAFPLAPHGSIAQSYPLPLQPVFAFLPVRPYGFHFLLQADFLLPSSRDTLSESAPRNRWLMERLPTLMPHALAAWKQHLRRGTPGVNLLDFYHTLPYSAVNIANGRGAADTEFGPFRPAAVEMMRALEQLECVLRDQSESEGGKGMHTSPGVGGTWVKPSAVFSSPHALVRTWLPSSFLERRLQRAWLHPSLQTLPDGLKAAIGIEELDAPRLVDLIRLECRAFQESQRTPAGGKHRAAAAAAKKIKQQQSKAEKAERRRLRLEAKANKRKLKTAAAAGPIVATTETNTAAASPSDGCEVAEEKEDGAQPSETAAVPSAGADPSAQADQSQQPDALPEAAEQEEKVVVEDAVESDEEEEEEEKEEEDDQAWQTEFGPAAGPAGEAADPVQVARAAAHRNFLCRALLALQLLLQGHPDHDALLNKLRMLQACPLSDGSFTTFVAPDAQRAGSAPSPVLMRDWDQNGAASTSQTPSKAPVTPWQSILEAPLRLLHTQLLDGVAALDVTSPGSGSGSSSSAARLPASSTRVQSLRKLLLELGVEPVDDHRVLQSAVNRVRDIGTHGQADVSLLQLPGTRQYCHASILFAQQHLASCVLPACTMLRRDLADCALLECVAVTGATGSVPSLMRLEDVRTRLLLGPEYSDTRLSSALTKLRQACPAHFSFLTLHPCYLQAAVQQAMSASSGGSRQALIAQCRQQWLEFLVPVLRIQELWPLTPRIEAMSIAKLRADPRATQWPEAFQRQLADDGDVLLMDFCAPQLEQLFDFVSSLPTASQHARLAHALLNELFNHFAVVWSAQGEPFAQLRLRTNVVDFDSALREKDIRISAPSSFVSLLRDAAWIPMSRVRVAAPLLADPGQRSSSVQPAHRTLYSSSALYLPTAHNMSLLPLDTPFLECPPEQEQSTFLMALCIEAKVSAARLHHLLTAEWSQQPGGFRSSLMRMAAVYKFLDRHGNERVQSQSVVGPHGGGGDHGSIGPKLSAQQLRYARRLPDSASIDDSSDSEVIRDLFDKKSNERPVVWHPLPERYGGAEVDPRSEQLGFFFAPSQFVLYDSKPEILNVVKEHAEWYRMPAPLPMLLLKQAYRDTKAKSIYFNEINQNKTPYLETLTRALAHWAQLVHQQQQSSTSTRSSHSARHSAGGPSSLMSTEECAALLCRWRRYVSEVLLASNYANHQDMREERDRTTVLLQTSRMFPCFRSGEDGAQVHLCTLQDRPILNDAPLLCERFLASAAQLQPAHDPAAPPLHFLLFADVKRDTLSTDCQPHASTDALAWAEYGLRRLSEVCERHLLVEEETAAGGRGDQMELHDLLQRLVRCMQRFLYNTHPGAHASLQAGDMAHTLRSYNVVCCARLAEEWVVEGVASDAQHCAVLHDAEAQRVLVHARDLKMSALTTLQQVVDVVCRLVCDGVPEASRPARMQEQLAEFAHSLLPHRHQHKEMSRMAEQQCPQALPRDEQLWNFCAAAPSTSSGGAEPQQARRVMIDSLTGGFNSASVFGKNAPVLAPAPSAALSGGGMPPSADSIETDQRPTFTAAFPAAVSPSADDADSADQSDRAAEGASSEDRRSTAAVADGTGVSARSGPPSSGEQRAPSDAPATLPPSEAEQPRAPVALGLVAGDAPASAQRDGDVSAPRPAPSSATAGADGAHGERRAQPHGVASHASAAPRLAPAHDTDPVFDALVQSAGGFSPELASARAGAPLSSEEPLPVAVREWLHQAMAPVRQPVPSVPGVSAAAIASVPSNATGLELAALMAGWSARFLPAGGPSTQGKNGGAACPSAESLLLIGRWGEALVYQTLLQREAERCATDPSAAARVVRWVNRDGESGLPYDLTVTVDVDVGAEAGPQPPPQLFIEVKSSVQCASAPFDISAREVSCALQRLGAYEIFRVTGAGSALAQIHRIQNPAGAWHRKQLRVFMEI